MLKKIWGVFFKTIIGLFVLYMVIGFVIVPFALPWVVERQGKIILKHDVKLRSAAFNPFLLQLSLNDFQVLDHDKTVMVGFKRLKVDVSFLAFFKKIYRVESVTLDGLNIHAVLLPDGKVNLMDLIPLPAQAAPSVSPKPNAQAVQPLPLVIVDDVNLKSAEVHFADQASAPGFQTSLHELNIHATGFSTRAESVVNVKIDSKLGEKGVISSETNMKPLASPLELETSLTLNSYAMNILTPYVGKYTGRTLSDGEMDFRMDYRIANNKLAASHKVLIQKFEFGSKVESKDALPLPFGLVVALLEDPQGRIKVSLPVTGDLSDPKFQYWPLVGQVVRNFFFGLVAKPFAFLASTLGVDSGMDEMGYVKFLPGRADISDAEKEKIRLIIKGLKDRPKLMLSIGGVYDPVADWKAIQAQVVDKDFSALRQQSTRSDSRVYQDLYQRRFGIQALWAVAKKYKLRQGAYDDEALLKELKRQLIEEGAGDKPALEALAKTRAESVRAFLLSEGFDAGRLSLAPVVQVQASMGFVPQEFILTVFDSKASSVDNATVPFLGQ